MYRDKIAKKFARKRQRVRSLSRRAQLRAEEIWQEAKRIFETGEERSIGHTR